MLAAILDGRGELAHGPVPGPLRRGPAPAGYDYEPQRARALLAEDLVDEIVVFRAGKVLGGDARDGVGLFGFTELAQVPQFGRVDVLALGPDVMEVWRRA